MVKVLMVGSHKSVKGGITSVVNQITKKNWELEDIFIKYIPTYIDSHNFKKILFFIKGYVNIFIESIFKKPDVMYIHMSYKGSFHRKFYIHRLAKKFKIKTIIHLHGSEFEKFFNDSNEKVKCKIKKMLSQCDAMIVLGDEWEKKIKAIEPCTKIVILPNSISIPNQIVKYSDNVFQILYLGVLIKRKGITDLIEAFIKLKELGFLEKNDIRLIVAGTGDEEETLKRKVFKAGLDSYIKFTGWIDGNTKEELLNSSQLLVLPSYNEGLPISILEAISYGLPIVSTDVGSVNEAVINGSNGFLIKPGNIDQLAKSIENIVNSRVLWEQFSTNSKKLAIEKFDEKNYFKRLREIIYK